jgi:SAM-dependent methyltransferase
MDTPTIGIYERSAQRWRSSRGAAPDDLGRRLRQLAGDGPVVDLGCGYGRYLPQITSPVVGLDATAAMLELAREHGTCLVRGDLEALPFAGATFAGAFARHSYVHLPRHRLAGALGELWRVLKPAAPAVISMIEGAYEGDGLPGDDFPGRYFTLWPEQDLLAAVRAAGFRDAGARLAGRPRRRADLVVTAWR